MAMANRGQDGSDWITANEAAAVLGCSNKKLPLLARKGLIAVRRIPCCNPRYLRADAERLVRESTTPATPSAGAELGGTGRRMTKGPGGAHAIGVVTPDGVTDREVAAAG